MAELCTKFGLNNLAYLGLNPNGSENGKVRIFSTYDKDWTDRYSQQNYHLIDPVVTEGMRGILPVDWSVVPKKDHITRSFFGEANEFGVRENGVSIPVRDPSNGRALFSVNTEMTKREWSRYKQEFIADFTYLGFLIHNDVIKNETPEKKVKLSPREAEVLRWAALGKTASETGAILQVSSRTVTYYLTNACAKLQVTNKTHAVARAIQGQHIAV